MRKICALWLFLLAAACCVALPSYGDAGTDLDTVQAYAARYLGKHVRAKREAYVLNEIAPMIVTYARQYKIDPLLVAVNVKRESGFNHKRIGKRGEVGLMQTHCTANGAARRAGASLATPQGQLIAGVSWLAESIKHCDGDVLKGLNAYMTKGSKCGPPIVPGARARFNEWQREIKR